MTTQKKNEMFIAMVRMALSSMQFSYEIDTTNWSESRNWFDFNFTDNASGITGTVSLMTNVRDGDETINHMTVDITDSMIRNSKDEEYDSFFESVVTACTKPKADVVFDDDGACYMFMDGIPLTDAISISTIIMYIQSALISVLRVRSIMNNYNGTG